MSSAAKGEWCQPPGPGEPGPLRRAIDGGSPHESSPEPLQRLLIVANHDDHVYDAEITMIQKMIASDD